MFKYLCFLFVCHATASLLLHLVCIIKSPLALCVYYKVSSCSVCLAQVSSYSCTCRQGFFLLPVSTNKYLLSLCLLYTNKSLIAPRAHSFGQFQKHALSKARTQSPCFSYPRLARAFQSAGSADLLSFGGVSVGWPQNLFCWLPVYEQAKMRPVYMLILALAVFLSLFFHKINVVAFFI